MALSPSPIFQKRKRELYLPVSLTLLDLAGVMVGLLLAYWIRFHSGLIEVTRNYMPTDYLKLFPVATGVWLVSFCFVHLYRRNERVWGWRAARRIVRGSFLALAIFVTILFFHRSLTVFPLARWMIPLSMTLVFLLVSLGRFILDRKLDIRARALVLGFGPSAKEVATSIVNHPEFGWEAVGFISADSHGVGKVFDGLSVIGSVEDLPEILDRDRIEAVFVAKSDFRHEMLRNVFFECEKRMVDVKVMPDLTEMLYSDVHVEEVDGIPFLGLRETPLQGWNRVLKRAFDVAGSSLLLLVFGLPMFIIAWLVKRDSEGPVFFHQERVGADGRHFHITKFRTMFTDAETQTGPVFSTPDDPRQTRVGRRLRQMHLDELPQILNVFKGEMSLVGPRPERPYFVNQFREQIPRYMARHRIKSGMTGWAQVNGQTGHEGTIAERLKYDLYYIENWSIFFDLKVLLLTNVWLLRRVRQMITLPADHPSLRRSHGMPVVGEVARSSDETSDEPASAVDPDDASERAKEA